MAFAFTITFTLYFTMGKKKPMGERHSQNARLKLGYGHLVIGP
jgi:hypothetical protein